MQRLTLFIAAVVVPLAATLNNQFLQFDIHSMHRTDQNAMSLDAMLNGSSDQLIAAIGSGATSGGRKGKQRRHTETLVGEAPELAAIGSGATSGGRKGKQRRHTETLVGGAPELAAIGSGATSGGRKGKQRRHTETFVGETPKLAMIG